MAGTGKKTLGRRKIDMKKIENDEDLMTAFSKRRSGIYKKASELATMCGAEVALLIFSPAGKPFSLGFPEPKPIINRFLNMNAGPAADDIFQPMFDAHRRKKYDEEVGKLCSVLDRLDLATGIGNSLETISRATREGIPERWEPRWWDKSPGELSWEELKQQLADIEATHKDILDHLNPSAGVAAVDHVDPMVEPLPLNNPPTGVEAQPSTSGEKFQD